MGNGKKPSARALALNLEGLFKLLGKTSDDRLRFWEIVKGITSVAEFELATLQIETMNTMVQNLAQGAKALQKTAGTISKQ
jgi:hypothetical protein